MLKTNNKSAFTLLELIVAMAIIAVLMGLSVFAIRAVQVSQRDTERNSSLVDIGVAMGQIYQNTGQYPASVDFYGNEVVLTPAAGNGTAQPVKIPLKGAAKAIDGNANATLDSKGAVYCYSPIGSSDYIVGVKLEATQSYKYIGNTDPATTPTCSNKFSGAFGN